MNAANSDFPAAAFVIAVDAMGGDHGPKVTVAAVLSVLREDPDLYVILHGDQALIQPELSKASDVAKRLCVRHTDQAVAMDEKPAQAIRRRGTSMANAIHAVKSGEARAAVSAGNTGALMALSKMILKMMAEDLDRPAIGCSWPNARGVGTVLDVGANVTSDARQLVEFALMGAAFHRALRGGERPTVGLLNIGSEDVKGHDEVREAHRLLREGEYGFEYKGFVEGDDLCGGAVDVVVTDGFTGNVALKTAEGTARFIRSLLKEALTSSPLAMLGALLCGPALKAMARRIDPSSANGGPLLGLNGIVVKSHGGADVRAFATAVRVTASLARSRYVEDVAEGLSRVMSEARSSSADEAVAVGGTGSV